MAGRARHRTVRRTARPRGFTLIELLVAIVVLTAMTGIVYASFRSVADTTAMARKSAEELRFRQFLWRNFHTNLNSLYIDPACVSPEYQFLGTDEQGAFGPADALRFCTALPMDGPDSLPGVLKVVTYQVVDQYEAAEGEVALGSVAEETPEGESGGMLLEIVEEPLVLEGEDFAAEDFEGLDEMRFERHIPISTLDIKYYDGPADEWLDQWDSALEQRLPWAVRVKINFARTEEEWSADISAGMDPEESPDLDLTAALPVGAGVVEPFIDPNHFRALSFQEGGEMPQDIPVPAPADGGIDSGADTDEGVAQ